ncbi:MAG TPA: Hpt domain-containing protein [Bryobacteraceae bacterium]|nr:Hpt domain-containing protein [Bryobacteraceae bacterium]
MEKDTTTVLDLEQLREVTLDDEALMREVLQALVDDTRRQMLLLDAAIREQDATRCVRLAHYSKGACANVGARSAAEILKEIETKAANRDFPECQTALNRLAKQVDLIHSEAVSL